MLPELPTYQFEPSLAGLLSLLLTIALPIVVGLVTTRLTHPGLKATLLLLLSTVKAFIEAWIAAANSDVPFNLLAVLMALSLNFGIAVVIHFGLWKPTGVAERAADSLVTERR